LKWRIVVIAVAAVAVIAGLALAWRASTVAADAIPPQGEVAVLGGKLIFSDVAAQSREFMGYHSSIRLTASENAIKREVLQAMPAACCKDSNAYTCCCNCNLSKTVWGLSNFVVARHGASADELRAVVRAWYAYINPAGYSGDSCYVGGCSRAFPHNGCGGMSENNLEL
jgi:hypothetical protein